MLKIISLLSILLLISILIYAFLPMKKITTSQQPSLYDFTFQLRDIHGKPIDFHQFKGKKLLLVNVASECGFTPQYADLQKLHDTYKDKVTLIGIPCNQFGNQEPGSLEEIQEFCSTKFGVTFLMTEKINVKGTEQHQLYQWLTQKSLNGLKDSSVKWNFQKYLLNEQGQLIDYYYSITNPMSDAITKHF